MDLIAYANYEHDKFCFIAVPLKGKITLGPCPQNKILVPFRRAPHHFYMGVHPPPRRGPPKYLQGVGNFPFLHAPGWEMGGK